MVVQFFGEIDSSIFFRESEHRFLIFLRRFRIGKIDKISILFYPDENQWNRRTDTTHPYVKRDPKANRFL